MYDLYNQHIDTELNKTICIKGFKNNLYVKIQLKFGI